MTRAGANEAKNNLATTNAIGAQNNTQQQQLEASLIPDYQSEMQGYTPAQQNAMTTAGEGAIGSAYGSADKLAANTAARTGNASNLTGQQDELALQKGQAMGSEAAGLQTDFAKQQQLDQKFGLQGLTGLNSQNAQETEAMYGLGPNTINAQSNAYTNPAMSIVNGALGAAGAAAA